MRWVCYKCGKVEKGECPPETWIQHRAPGFARVLLECPVCHGGYAVKEADKHIRHRRSII